MPSKRLLISAILFFLLAALFTGAAAAPAQPAPVYVPLVFRAFSPGSQPVSVQTHPALVYLPLVFQAFSPGSLSESVQAHPGPISLPLVFQGYTVSQALPASAPTQAAALPTVAAAAPTPVPTPTPAAFFPPVSPAVVSPTPALTLPPLSTPLVSPTPTATIPALLPQTGPPTPTATLPPLSSPVESPTSSAAFPPLSTPTRTPIPTLVLPPTPTVNPADVSILPNHSHYFDRVGNLHIVGEVENRSPYTLRYIKVPVDLFDAAGSWTASGLTYLPLENLAPGQKSCFRIILEDLGEWSYYQFGPLSYWADGTPPPNLKIFNYYGVYDPRTEWFMISGQIRNDDQRRVEYVSPVGTLYAENGIVVSCDFTYIDANPPHLDPGQSSSFRMIFSSRGSTKITTFRVQVEGHPR